MASLTAPSTPLTRPVEIVASTSQNSVSDRASQTVEVASSNQPDPSSNLNRRGTMEAPMTAAAIDLESYLHQTLNLCNKLAKTNLDDPALTASELQGSVMCLNSEVAAAKMLNYCIRMLHADGWHPPTVIRAMVLRETGLEAGMKTTLYKALRERREEIKIGEAKRAGVVTEEGEAVIEKVAKKNGSKGVGRRSTLPGRNRKGRAMTAGGADAKNVRADEAMHQVVLDDCRNGPYMNLI